MLKSFEDCINHNCKKCQQIMINDFQIIPFENCNSTFQKLFSYFLYSAPNIESSFSKTIPQRLHLDLFRRMMEERHFAYQKMCPANAVIETELTKGNLNGEYICLKCKRFVCKKKKTNTKENQQETDLECFLRHIRNAIAHGRVYLYNDNKKHHIIFEDENTSKNLSARIICIKADLEHWKKLLNDSRNYTNE